MFIPKIAARDRFIDMNLSGCFNHRLMWLWCRTRGASSVFLYVHLSDTHNPSIHTSIYPIHGTKSDLRLWRRGFFLSRLSFLFSHSLPLLFLCCFLPLGFCVVNSGESLRDEKGKDATLGIFSVKDRGRDRWRGISPWENDWRKKAWSQNKWNNVTQEKRTKSIVTSSVKYG